MQWIAFATVRSAENAPEMLSYRHAFHAGNHADVFKHVTQLALLDYLNQKDKNYYYIDTHAGAGLYALTKGYAAKNTEYESGIGKLWRRHDLPEILARYVALVKTFNPDGALCCYPGSPLLAQRVMRAGDKSRLFELHPADYDLLTECCADKIKNKQVYVQKADGFTGIKAALPPPLRRGLVLVDPAYEVKSDYISVIRMLREGLLRFATGIYAVWYPLLSRPEVSVLAEKLEKLPFKTWLHVTLIIQKPAANGFGMFGSAMFIGNPPWMLAETLGRELPYLTERLRQDDAACFSVKTS